MARNAEVLLTSWSLPGFSLLALYAAESLGLGDFGIVGNDYNSLTQSPLNKSDAVVYLTLATIGGTASLGAVLTSMFGRRAQSL